MGQIIELSVTKGKTVKIEDREEWIRSEYSLRAKIDHNEELQVARAQMEGMINAWLTPSKSSGTQEKGLEIWDASQILWKEATSQKGVYQRSEDYDNLHHKALVRDLNQHKGFFIKNRFKYWLFDDGSTVGRKRNQA